MDQSVAPDDVQMSERWSVRNKMRWCVGGWLSGFLLLMGVSGVLHAIEENEVSPYYLVKEYYIGVDDELDVNVWRQPELSVSVPVRPDGMISLPLVGELKAEGLTPKQLSDLVRDRLAKFVRDPKVAIILTQLRSHEFLSQVRVLGAVGSVTSLPYRPGMTVLDVVLEAGGVSEFSSPNGTKLYRKFDGKTRTIEVNLKDILSEGKLETNYTLRPGDVITVPEKLF
ncbi:MAG: polysaccharide biosynthesis/export family protein [Gammaproteobacteria bacterium]|nr:polysaccharide biosynthesis/export family protein [Gammaproteobacteria bacterium]